LDLNFTSQNQDTVPSQNGGLYDFLFREYNPQHGRWISLDPAGMSAVSLSSPQSCNRYAYLSNGPLTAVDLLGLINTDRFHGAGYFDDSCSIDGAAASCTLVSSLAAEGGGGAVGFLMSGVVNPVLVQGGGISFFGLPPSATMAMVASALIGPSPPKPRMMGIFFRMPLSPRLSDCPLNLMVYFFR